MLCSLGYYQVPYIKFSDKFTYQESEENITLPEKADSGGTHWLNPVKYIYMLFISGKVKKLGSGGTKWLNPVVTI